MLAQVHYKFSTNKDGSTFYPTTGETSTVGRDFIFSIDALSWFYDEVILRAFEPADITITDTDGNIALSKSMSAGGLYYFSALRPLDNGKVYHLTSTGDVSLMSSSNGPYGSISSDNGIEVGKKFGFNQMPNYSTFVVFAYEDASITGGRPGAPRHLASLKIGEWILLGGFRGWQTIESSGLIAVWAGNRDYYTKSDEFLPTGAAQNTGVDGQIIRINTMRQTGHLYAHYDDTQVTINGELHTLDSGERLELPKEVMYEIVATKPVVVQTGEGRIGIDLVLKPFPAIR